MMLRRTIDVKHFPILLICIALLLESLTLPVCAQSSKSRKPELIRDTDAAEGKEAVEAPKAKEQNPALAKQNINIGNFYLKQKNYAAAIERYLEAIEYQSSSIRAYEALARAYEKNGEITKAISTYKTLLDKNPDSPGSSDFRVRLSKLEKKSS
jgi:tetratricopeptide (TPR) repeat protein